MPLILIDFNKSDRHYRAFVERQQVYKNKSQPSMLSVIYHDQTANQLDMAKSTATPGNISL